MKESLNVRKIVLTSEILILPNAFEFTMLGLAAGGGAFSFKNGST